MADGAKVPKVAFQAGTVYFRHGAKSEPTNSHDLKVVFLRRLDSERKAFMSNIRKVVAMPPGAEVRVIPGDLAQKDRTAVPFRLVDDPGAPEVRALDFDKAYPYRQKEAAIEVNKRLDGAARIIPFHIQCVRKLHGIDGKPMYSHATKFASRQYSEAFIEWMMAEYRKDPEFFEKARRASQAAATK
jgi:hypothetical protein